MQKYNILLQSAPAGSSQQQKIDFYHQIRSNIEKLIDKNNMLPMVQGISEASGMALLTITCESAVINVLQAANQPGVKDVLETRENTALKSQIKKKPQNTSRKKPKFKL